MAVKLIINSKKLNTEVEITKDVTSIGRSSANDVKLEDSEASREHCRLIRMGPGQYKIVDLDSKNGTKVNGKDTKEALLVPGDTITVGDSRLTFMFDVVHAAQLQVPPAPLTPAQFQPPPQIQPQPLPPSPLPFQPQAQVSPPATLKERKARQKVDLSGSIMNALVTTAIGVLVLGSIMTIAVIGKWLPVKPWLTVTNVWLATIGAAILGILLQVCYMLIVLNLKKTPQKNKRQNN